MRNTDSSGNTRFTTSLSCLALSRSWPNGFSITTRRHRSGSGWANRDRDSFSSTVGNAPGGIAR